MKGEANFIPRKSLREQRKFIDRKAWQTEGSPLALFQTLRNDLVTSGCSVGDVNSFIPLANFVDRAFMVAGKPPRQEEKLIEPVAHSYRVALRFVEGTRMGPDRLPTYAAIALLHDVLEDTPVSYQALQMKYGDKVAQGVVALSRHVEGKKISTDEYYKRLSNADPEIQWIKVADRIENLSVFLRMSQIPDLLDENKFRLPSKKGVLAAMEQNLDESKKYVLALAEGNPVLKADLLNVIRQTEQRLEEIDFGRESL